MNTETRGYSLIDSGNGKRLERFGAFVLARPAPQALWRPRQPAALWDAADAAFERRGQDGEWRGLDRLPPSWPVEIDGLTALVKPTGFGHVGLFPEQAANWAFVALRAARGPRPYGVMNLFGYTGLATLYAARAGAEVCHLDASKAVVAWARENAAASGLADFPVRWIVEDAVKFLRREAKRGRRYHGLVLDPPAFGRGSKGEVWKIEDDLEALLAACREALDEAAEFVILSTYSPKFTPLVLANVLSDAFGDRGGAVEAAEMTIPEADGGRSLPAGVTARWVAKP
ncbi:MAG: hypothetical protein C4523_14670 [Myxococcales bacterium]|nr:MAG: hypothetical protein C4523_14670 [Myxococcales bacterium]